MSGVTYIAKDTESFRALYEQFKQHIFKSAALSLPSDSEIKARMKIGLSGCLDSLDQVDEIHTDEGSTEVPKE